MNFFFRNKVKHPEQSPSQRKWVENRAESCIDLFKEKFDLKLDYSPSSLKAIDQFLIATKNSSAFSTMKNGEYKWLVNTLGGYALEVAQKKFGGEYLDLSEKEQPYLVCGYPKFELGILFVFRIEEFLNDNTNEGVVDLFTSFKEMFSSIENGNIELIM